MNKRGQSIIAWILIGFGGLLLLGNFTQINFDKIFWPSILIVLGLVLVLRPKTLRVEGDVKYSFAGDVSIGSSWEPKNEEYWMFAGDFDIDLTVVDLPEGETHIRVLAFATEATIRLPKDVGFSMDANGIVTKLERDGVEQENIFSGTMFSTEGYADAARKLRFETLGFVAEVEILDR